MADQRPRDARAVRMRVGGLAPIIVLLVGCGIQPTSVVDAGEPPSGVVLGDPDPVLNEPGESGPGESGDVYFVRAGKLTPVSRPNLLDRVQQANRDGAGTDPITLSMQELLIGPSADEVGSGISSELLLRPSQTPLQVISPGPNTVLLAMDMVTDELSPLAALQITCTVRAAAPAAGRSPDVEVLRLHDGRTDSLPGCPADLGP